MTRLSHQEVRIGLAARLHSRSAEIEEAIVARIRDVSPDSPGDNDVQYEEGQRAAVAAVLEYALAGVEHRGAPARPIPPMVIVQTHRAARCGVELGTILRRYHAASAELTDFVTQEADAGGLLGNGMALRGIQRAQALFLDRLILTINEEYIREGERIERSPDQRRADRVRRLLNGEQVESNELGYDLDTWHLGMIGKGLGVGQAIRGMATGLDSRLLCVSHDEQSVWAWLGGKHSAVVSDIKRLLSAKWPAGLSLALGEPMEGIEGWCHTHQQAQDAFLVSLCQPRTLTLYADVALVVPWLRDETRARWLVETYLSPLDNRGRSGAKLRATLRAYLDSGRNASATSKALNVTRRTIHNRINLIEQRLGPLFDERQAELELAMRLDDLMRQRRAASRLLSVHK
jgi:hypothetical protein